jgi:hypothetical protein
MFGVGFSKNSFFSVDAEICECISVMPLRAIKGRALAKLWWLVFEEKT